MAEETPSGTPKRAVVIRARLDLDLRAEAQQWFRKRIRIVGTGLILGCAFVGIGAYEDGVLVAKGFSVDYLIGLLLALLGLAVIGVSLYSGLLNPVTRLRGNASGLTFERRWGGARAWSWKAADFRLDIDDRGIDPTASEVDRNRLFFEGPGAIYGNLARASVGPLLDVARTYGAVVSVKQLEQSERGGIRLVRRIRVRPSPIL